MYDIISLDICETQNERCYIWKFKDFTLSARLSQLPAGKTAILCAQISGLNTTKDFALTCTAADGREAYTLILADRRVVEQNGLRIRGTEYILQLEKDNVLVTPALHCRTPIRYPYGRTKWDIRTRLLQTPEQGNVIEYDPVNLSTSTDLTEVQRFLGDTDVSSYLDHIVATVTEGKKTQMERVIAIGEFLGSALQHNALHMNLKETLPAMERFSNDGWEKADIEKEAVWLMELGHTRCGTINGMVACALLRRIHVPNKTFFGCGGHTSGQVYVDGEWRLFDVDAFKKQLPLDDKGNLPAISWLKKDNNWLLLDTLPAWEDSPREEGWITDRGGTQITGTLGGGRDRSEIGYASEWINGGVKCKLYPPSVPQLLPVRYRQGNRVLLEWIGSYARNNNLQGYEVEIQDISSGHCVQYRTDKTFLMVNVGDSTYSWTVRALDDHGKGSHFHERIYYAAAPAENIPVHDMELTDTLLPICEETDSDGRAQLGPFMQMEGFDDFLGETSMATTLLTEVPMGMSGRKILYLVDPTSYWASGNIVRSLFHAHLNKLYGEEEKWTAKIVMHVKKADMAGTKKCPVVWFGREHSNFGLGVVANCNEGKLFLGTNIYGDWRSSFQLPCDKWFILEMTHLADTRKIVCKCDGQELGTIDESGFCENVFAIDSAYIASNPEAEISYMVADIGVY